MLAIAGRKLKTKAKTNLERTLADNQAQKRCREFFFFFWLLSKVMTILAKRMHFSSTLKVQLRFRNLDSLRFYQKQT